MMLRRSNRCLLICSLAVLLSCAAQAQVVRVGNRGGPVALRGPAPRLTILGSLSVVATPSLVTFNLVSAGTAAGSAPVVVVTTWSGISLFSTGIGVYAYFSNASSALSGGTPVAYIPSSCVLGKDSAGIPTGFTAFTQSSPVGGAGNSLELYTGGGGLLGLGGNHTDTLNLEINLSSIPQLPAATYTGTLMVQAEAF